MDVNNDNDNSNNIDSTGSEVNNTFQVVENPDPNSTFIQQSTQSSSNNIRNISIIPTQIPTQITKTPTKDSVDELFSLICNKMSSLSTTTDGNSNTNTSSSDNHNEMISAFVSVIMCSESEAKFFLESTNWDVASVSIVV